MNEQKSHIISTLLYYDIFSYPLKFNEIVSFFTNQNGSREQIRLALEELYADGFVLKHKDYYYISGNKELIERREQGNEKAALMLKTAYRFSRLISWFPYVRCVCLSGSLSKGFMDESGDIDYFIITQPGRLWIARTLLIAFKKIFLLNSRKYFCVNYFIDTNHLEIPDKNIFTATEVLTLVPVYNHQLYAEFLRSNEWARSFLPHHKSIDQRFVLPEKKYPLKHLLEKSLNGSLGEKLDTWFMQLTIRKWKKKFSHFTADHFEHALRSRKYVSKHHPQNFQLKVLGALRERIDHFEKIHDIQLALTNV